MRGDCFNNTKNKALDGQHDNTQHNVNHYEHDSSYVSRGQGCGQGCYTINVPLLTNPFPTLYIEQAPANTPPDALSTVTNTNNSASGNNQAYILKLIKKPKRGGKIADGYMMMLSTAKQSILMIYITVKQPLMQ